MRRESGILVVPAIAGSATGAIIGILAVVLTGGGAGVAIALGLSAGLMSALGAFVSRRLAEGWQFAAWQRAAERGQLHRSIGPGLRFDLMDESARAILDRSQSKARQGHQHSVGIENLLLAYLDTNTSTETELRALLAASLASQPQLISRKPKARLGWTPGAIAAVEASYGEAVLDGEESISARHLLKGARAALANPAIPGPPQPFRPEVLRRLGHGPA